MTPGNVIPTATAIRIGWRLDLWIWAMEMMFDLRHSRLVPGRARSSLSAWTRFS